MTKIFTSYFGNFRALDKAGVLMIGISRFPPTYFKGPTIFDLAPHANMLKLPPEEYDKLFAEKVLGTTTTKEIIKQIEWYSSKYNVNSVALCCYEKEQKDCHRYNVAEWFKKYGIQVEEFFIEEKKIEEPKADDQLSLF